MMKLKGPEWPEGTILLFGVRYKSSPLKVYTFVAMKVNDLWHFSGHNGPQAASWGAVTRWLERDDRELVWVRQVTQTKQVWPEPPEWFES